MNRRQLLVMLSASSVGAFAGCIDDANSVSGSSTHPDDMEVTTLHVVDNVIKLEFSDRERSGFDYQEEQFTIISNGDDAENGLIDSEDVQTFVEETDFSESYLLIVQTGMSPQKELSLDRIERINDGLAVTALVEIPDDQTDALATHSLLIRITDEGDTIPEELNVEIQGYEE